MVVVADVKWNQNKIKIFTLKESWMDLYLRALKGFFNVNEVGLLAKRPFSFAWQIFLSGAFYKNIDFRKLNQSATV